MSALAVMFIAMGIADVCRRLSRGLWLSLALAPLVVVGCAVLAGLWHLGDIALLVIAGGASVAWLLLCDRAEAPVSTSWRRWGCSVPRSRC